MSALLLKLYNPEVMTRWDFDVKKHGMVAPEVLEKGLSNVHESVKKRNMSIAT